MAKVGQQTEYNAAISGLGAIKEYKNDTHFDNESALCDFLETNLARFCEERLGGKLVSYKREFSLEKTFISRRGYSSGRARRVDFMVELANGQRAFIECKGVAGNATLAISQLLGYSIMSKADRLVIVASTYDDLVYNIVERYKLPIEVYFFSKNYTLHINAQ